MTQEAFHLIDRALSEQHARNEARRIRTRVHEARGNPHPAGFRWPFELLQNALDSGPRDGSAIEVRIRCEASRLTFEHTGAPFTSIELAALLSGGSSKEFESEVTTGRFGTGFLVTHALADRTTLRGLLKVQDGYERFELVLDRSGTEEDILRNTQACNEAIRAAIPANDYADIPSASFEYPTDNNQTLLIGLEALKQALPYLYVTRVALGRVTFEEADGAIEIWTPGPVERKSVENGQVEYRAIRVERDGALLPSLIAHRFTHDARPTAAALVLAEESEGQQRIRVPEAQAPRIYREYPLRGSGFLPINFVLDGKFDPDQERIKLSMGDDDRGLLEIAFDAAVVAVKHAAGEKWLDAHLLAWAEKPVGTFDPTDAVEKDWWIEQLSKFASSIAELPIVESSSQLYPAIDGSGATADFVIPRLLPDSAVDETSVARLWPLVATASDLLPPKEVLAVDWTRIAEGWHSLGLEINRITVDGLAKSVREGVKDLDALQIDGDPIAWLARFLDVVGECWGKRSGAVPSVLEGLIPDQNRRLRSPAELSRDQGISEEIKRICSDIGLDVRGRLLLNELEQLATEQKLTHVGSALTQAIPGVLSEAQIIDEAIKHLSDGLPEDEECEEDSSNLQYGTVRLLDYLWRSHGAAAAATARRLPLIAKNNHAVRWSHDRMMMAPIGNWHNSARPFAKAYPPQRVLQDIYAGEPDKGLPDVVSALIGFGIAIADPITEDTPAELRGERLEAISEGATEGATVSNQKFSQIALLQPELFNRCQEGVEEAQALLGLVLCHVAPHDPAWQQQRVVKGRKLREDINVRVRGALWLADLKFRSWVPVPGEDGKLVKVRASAKTLGHLLHPTWLQNNDAAIRLLSEFFEFDELELRLLGLAPDADKRRELRSGIARLVETGGANPEFYVTLADQIEEQRRKARDIERFRRLGIAVQEAVKLALENCGLRLKLVDRGFDYEVAAAADDVLEDLASKIEAGPYLLEIKATTKGQARLTPTQAETASEESSRYSLCVVDLRNVSPEELDGEWSADRVQDLARVVSDIGESVRETCELVENARTNSVGIRNEAALRYEVPTSLWEAGISIDEWAAAISAAMRAK